MAEPVIDPLLGRCAMLPLPSLQEPGIVRDEGGRMKDERGLSCAELMALNAQSLMINQAMAGWLATYAYRLLLAHDLDIYQTWVDLRGGSVRSVGITEGQTMAVGEPQTVQALDWRRMPRVQRGRWSQGGDILDVFMGDAEAQEVDILFCPACGWRTTLEDWENAAGRSSSPVQPERCSKGTIIISLTPGAIYLRPLPIGGLREAGRSHFCE